MIRGSCRDREVRKKEIRDETVARIYRKGFVGVCGGGSQSAEAVLPSVVSTENTLTV